MKDKYFKPSLLLHIQLLLSCSCCWKYSLILCICVKHECHQDPENNYLFKCLYPKEKATQEGKNIHTHTKKNLSVWENYRTAQKLNQNFPLRAFFALSYSPFWLVWWTYNSSSRKKRNPLCCLKKKFVFCYLILFLSLNITANLESNLYFSYQQYWFYK